MKRYFECPLMFLLALNLALAQAGTSKSKSRIKSKISKEYCINSYAPNNNRLIVAAE